MYHLFFLHQNVYLIVRWEKRKVMCDKTNVFLILSIDTMNIFRQLCISIYLRFFFFFSNFICTFLFWPPHRFCIMQRDLSMLLLLLLRFDIANSFSIHFHLISRINTIVCMLLRHYHNTYSHWQFHFHTRSTTRNARIPTHARSLTNSKLTVRLWRPNQLWNTFEWSKIKENNKKITFKVSKSYW